MFYATGAFYQTIGDVFGISKSIVEDVIEEVSFLIASKLKDQFICMPTPQDILQSKVLFMRMSNFPLCIAAVDGTHVLIRSYGGNDGEVYRNRKMVFSLNVQLAVSADVIIKFPIQIRRDIFLMPNDKIPNFFCRNGF